MKGISEAAGKIGFRTVGARLTFEQLDEEAKLPCILHWNQNHFVVLPPQNYNREKKNGRILIADPAHGLVSVNRQTFSQSWVIDGKDYGHVLLLEPSPLFYEQEEETTGKRSIPFFFRYLRPYRTYIIQLFVGMFVASILSLIAPFLTQGLVDFGIGRQKPAFITLILMAQLLLFAGTTAIELIRGWILLHMSARVNISIISDFLIKLMKLPIRFFDTKLTGDITQRISDHARIQQFLTGTSLTTLFSMVNLLVFSIILALYSIPILAIFFVGSVLSVWWILFFLRKRRDLDYARFQRLSENQNHLFEIITGMQEIKLNDSETMHRWQWERIQAKLFRINIDGLTLSQYQNIGFSFFTQLKNILISYVAAKEVLSGNISLGMMLSISYITGQLNSPISQLLSFLQAAQDAKLSIERLSEIQGFEEEEKENGLMPEEESSLQEGSITLRDISFQYGGPSSRMVLDKIDLTIPFGKTTAIVGASGSGKTTLMKLLLKFYAPTKGEIHVGGVPLNAISPKWWRSQCGVVQSDGFIFSNTIMHNIAVQEEIDHKRLLSAVRTAHIESFVNLQPMGFSTKIGSTGNGISSGQRQRILIARAAYKEPKFLFLDEATSTLDANNEKVIIENLQQFFRSRTVVVIAHRLSTVKHADQIVVMENGGIVELGDHDYLIGLKGKYYELVKNQLELGK